MSVSLSDIIKSRRGFRLTGPGKVFFSFLVTIIVIAMLTGNNLLFLVISVMMGFMIVSGIESERNIKDLEVTRLLPAEIFAGMQSHVRYVLKSPSRDTKRIVMNDLESIPIAISKKGETSMLKASACFEERGRHILGKIRIYTTFPYGLFEKSISFKFSSIAWKKQNVSLVTKVMDASSGVSTLVVLVPGKDIETKLGMATFLVLDFYARGLKFGIVVNNFYSGMDSSRTHKRTILERLALVREISEPIKVDDHAAESLIYI